MPIAITPNETWRFQLEDDFLLLQEGKLKRYPDPNGTWWTLGSLPASVEASIRDVVELHSDDNGAFINTNPGTVERRILENGVKGVEGFRTAAGHDVAIRMRKVGTREIADLDFLDYLKPHHRKQIADAIYLRTKTTLDELD